ncbi:MAG: AbrB/MazE/SpoVT family DNA-binding domain-containing protein [Steroidobacteraceae bacterium]|jgi:AbrB family looped-hinge helix DNA binding protein|nr:AbrB/MazE/SpoVT family DNA-binding domain-containing protein [Steroidobacteraceae bacterium]
MQSTIRVRVFRRIPLAPWLELLATAAAALLALAGAVGETICRADLDGRLTKSCRPQMETTKLSSKGQVVLPKSVRDAHGWVPGTEFEIEPTADGVRLRARAPFPRAELGQVFGSLSYAGPTRTLEEMDEGIRAAVSRRYGRAAKR